jgi:hypothetical protein
VAKNIYRTFLDLLPARDLQVGTVIAIDGGVATVELPGGGVLTVRGVAAVDDQVFVRDGVIEATAPSLTVVEIEI